MDNIELKPCPCCGGEVELQSSRDLNVFETYVYCSACDVYFFECETLADCESPGHIEEEKLCDKLVSMTYNRFCASSPTHYKEHFFENCTHDKFHF